MGHQHNSFCCFKQKADLLYWRNKENLWRERATLSEVPIMFLHHLTTLFQFLSRGYLLPKFLSLHSLPPSSPLPYTTEQGGLALSFYSCAGGQGATPCLVLKVLLFPHLNSRCCLQAMLTPMKGSVEERSSCCMPTVHTKWESGAGADPAEAWTETLTACSYTGADTKVSSERLLSFRLLEYLVHLSRQMPPKEINIVS